MSEPTMEGFPDGPTAFRPGTLIPAMKGCPNCRTLQMIASPELGECPDCGTALEIVSPGET